MNKKIPWACLFVAVLFQLLTISCATTQQAEGDATELKILGQTWLSLGNLKIAFLPFKFRYMKRHSQLGDIEAPTNAGDIVAKYMEKELFQSEKFKIIDRENLQKVIDEQKISASGLTENAAAIGKLLNVDGVVVGEVLELTTLKQVVNLNGTCIFSMKLIDIKTGEVVLLFKAEENVKFGNYWDALNSAAKKLRTGIMNNF